MEDLPSETLGTPLGDSPSSSVVPPPSDETPRKSSTPPSPGVSLAQDISAPAVSTSGPDDIDVATADGPTKVTSGDSSGVALDGPKESASVAPVASVHPSSVDSQQTDSAGSAKTDVLATTSTDGSTQGGDSSSGVPIDVAIQDQKDASDVAMDVDIPTADGGGDETVDEKMDVVVPNDAKKADVGVPVDAKQVEVDKPYDGGDDDDDDDGKMDVEVSDGVSSSNTQGSSAVDSNGLSPVDGATPTNPSTTSAGGNPSEHKGLSPSTQAKPESALEEDALAQYRKMKSLGMDSVIFAQPGIILHLLEGVRKEKAKIIKELEDLTPAGEDVSSDADLVKLFQAEKENLSTPIESILPVGDALMMKDASGAGAYASGSSSPSPMMMVGGGDDDAFVPGSAGKRARAGKRKSRSSTGASGKVGPAEYTSKRQRNSRAGSGVRRARDRPMNYHEKRALSKAVRELTKSQRTEIMKIIARQMPGKIQENHFDADFFDVDMQTLTNATLDCIDDYVKRVQALAAVKTTAAPSASSQLGAVAAVKKTKKKAAGKASSAAKRTPRSATGKASGKRARRGSTTSSNVVERLSLPPIAPTNQSPASRSRRTRKQRLYDRHELKSSVPESGGSIQLDDSMTKCRRLCLRLTKRKWGHIFASPVDPVALNIPDYFDIIKEPMDLGTVRSQLESGYYLTPMDYARDMRRIWSNALTYNPPATDVHKIALEFRKVFEADYGKIEKSYNDALIAM